MFPEGLRMETAVANSTAAGSRDDAAMIFANSNAGAGPAPLTNKPDSDSEMMPIQDIQDSSDSDAPKDAIPLQDRAAAKPRVAPKKAKKKPAKKKAQKPDIPNGPSESDTQEDSQEPQVELPPPPPKVPKGKQVKVSGEQAKFMKKGTSCVELLATVQRDWHAAPRILPKDCDPPTQPRDPR